MKIPQLPSVNDKHFLELLRELIQLREGKKKNAADAAFVSYEEDKLSDITDDLGVVNNGELRSATWDFYSKIGWRINLDDAEIQVLDELVITDNEETAIFTIDTDGHAVFEDQVSIGGATITDDALAIDWSPTDDGSAAGIDLNYSPSDTSSASNGYYAMRISGTNYYADAGVTNSAYTAGMLCYCHIDNSNHAGTIDDQFGVFSSVGILDATGNGTVNYAYAVRATVYFRDSTINNNTYAFYADLDGAAAGTISGDAYLYYGTWDEAGTVTGDVYGLYIDKAEKNYIDGDTHFLDNVGVGKAPTGILDINFSTEDLVFADAGSAGATEQDWIEVEVGGNTGYIRVYAAK